MVVLSLFDGMSCGRIALERAGIKVTKYFASEIDKHAIKVSKKNWPDIIHIGCVTKVRYADGWLYTEKGDYYVGHIDLIIGGSPCQGFSFAGKMLNFDDPRSKLFFEFVRIKRECNPSWFILENVLMKEKHRQIITKYMDINSVEINSALLSAQNRERLYWSNVNATPAGLFNDLQPNIPQPKDKGILLKHILQDEVEVSYFHTEKAFEYMNRKVKGGRDHWDFQHHSDTDHDKSSCLTANIHKGIPYNVLIERRMYLSEEEISRARLKYKSKVWKSGNRRGNMVFPDNVNKKSKCLCATIIMGARETIHVKDAVGIRKLTPVECERLQTVPDGYTDGVSDTQRYHMLGNGWTVDVIVYLLSFLPKQNQ
jgi:DNA-cytosine methyltransferase